MTFEEWFADEYTEVNNSSDISAKVVKMIARAAWENALKRKVPDAIDGSKIAYVYLDETTTDKLDSYVKGFNACRDKMLR